MRRQTPIIGIAGITIAIIGIGFLLTIVNSNPADAYLGGGDRQVFLPSVLRGASGVPSPISTPAPTPVVLGGQSRLGVWVGSNSSTMDEASQSGAKWVRVTVFWAEIEPSPGTYEFAALDSLLANAIGKGLNPIIEIRGNPSWAATSACGVIDKPGGLNAFGRFLQAFAQRYNSPPFSYSLKNWEFYNEADNTDVIWGDFLGGCWGDKPTEYVAMLQVASSAIKSVDSSALILLGGLAHENPPDIFNLGFLDEFLTEGGGQYIDVVNIHYFSSQSSTWSLYGHDIAGKVGKVRETMAYHGVNKPVAVTESGWTSSPGGEPDFSEKQAQYVPKLLARSLALDLYAVIWFSLADWSGADLPYGLMDQNLIPKLSYRAYQVAATEFGNANSIRALSPNDAGVASGIEGYVFDVGGQERWVLWAQGNSLEITLPTRATVAMDKLGQTIPLSSGGPTPIQLDSSPIFVRCN